VCSIVYPYIIINFTGIACQYIHTQKINILPLKGVIMSKKSQIKQKLFDLKDAATYLGRPVWGVRQMIWNGEIGVVRPNTKQWVLKQDLDDYIQKHYQQGGE